MSTPDDDDGPIRVWSWTHAVKKSKVPALTKYVCLILATRINDCGQGCFPSVKTILRESSLSNKTLSVHLQNAVNAGLLVIKRHKDAKGRNAGTTYLPQFPKNAVLDRQPAVDLRDEPVEIDDDDQSLDVRDTHGEPRVSEGESPGVSGTPIIIHTEELSKDTPKSPNGDFEENPDIEIQDHEATPQSSPSKLLADLMADGRHHNVTEHLLAPILSQRRFSSRDALEQLRSIRSAAKDLPKPALEKAVSIVLAGFKTVKPEHIRDALKAARMVAKADAADQGTTDAETIRVRLSLRKRLGDDVYRAWFSGLMVHQDGDRKLLVLPVKFNATYVQSNFSLHVEAVAGASARVVHAGEVRP